MVTGHGPCSDWVRLNSAQLGTAEVDMLLAFGLLRKAFPETGGSFPPQDEQPVSGFSTQLASPELSIGDDDIGLILRGYTLIPASCREAGNPGTSWPLRCADHSPAMNE